MTKAIPGTQETLYAGNPALERLNAARGVVYVDDLEWPIFDLERATTLAEYAGEIGLTVADVPRDNSVTDRALQIFRNDFVQAEPPNLKKGLYYPPEGRRSRPRKSVVTVSGGYCDLDRSKWPGVVPVGTGVGVSEEVYEEIVRHAAFFANQIDNRTQRAREAEPIVEAKADLGGESAVYALAEKHGILEARDQQLLRQRSILRAVHKNVTRRQSRRIRNLEPYRLEALIAIQEMVRIACRGLGYGTNRTQATLNAVASNTHRSPVAARWWAAYTDMAIRYNDAVRGKVNQSIHACIEEIGSHRENLINNIDRAYADE